jgi:hypothetical protein
LIISDAPRFIFIAVPKTGTSSIEAALGQYANIHLCKPFNKHVLAMKLKEDIPVERWAGSFKFAFVREPYAWLYSWYRFRQREALKNPGHPKRALYTGDISFDEFAHTFSNRELMLKQSDFITTHSGELLVDSVGHYESLQEDYSRVCERLEVPAQVLPRLNTSSSPGGLGDLSESGRRNINEYFRQDFELFDYEMK